MNNTTENSKRIAKNAFFLYMRMFLTMAVTFYTSRVILEALGVEDFGLYNVIGGIIAMFGLVNSSMATATQRFLTFETGRNDKLQMRKIFSVSLIIHILIAIIIILLGETIGLWFFWNKMNIPIERLDAALWVYQMSILSAVVMIISVPYNAAIIAHEKMNAFAYISILDVTLKLLSVYILFLYKLDRLKLYAILMLATQLILRLIYGLYCKKHFKETHGRFFWDTALFKKMIAFAGWSIWGNCAFLFCTQGLNILLNIFFSPVINAARAISVQVQNGIEQFSNSLQSAVNPQIIKSYATKEYTYMNNLIFYSSKFSFFLLWIIILPIYLNTNTILRIWLKEVPQYSVIFIHIMLIISLVEVLSKPLSTAISATGKIKIYQITIGCIMMLTLPISYIILRLGNPPESVFIVSLFFSFIAYISRFYLTQKAIKISILNYIKEVIYRICIVILTSYAICYLISTFFITTTITTLISCFLYAIITTSITYYIGLNNQEKQFVKNKISTKIK